MGPGLTPKQLGRYVVGAKIGGGGMATIYLGRAARPDGTTEIVALKVIRDELANDPQFSSMFVDEVRILARLSHPNVIHTLEYGVGGEHTYIAMELLSGRTYADVWDALDRAKRKMSVRLAAWICARVADGLHSAHELKDDQGAPLSVVHRDVNPANIFLTYDGDVKLIDFGLAKARVRVSKSGEGIVKGKIPYLAPEQVHGRPVDRRSDIYALGTTLWESVTMRRLFKRDTDVATLKAIRDARVPDARLIVPELPIKLWAAMNRALEHDPKSRYATAAKLRDDLDAFVGDASGLPAELGALLKSLFPGDAEKHAQWVRAAVSPQTPPMRTLPPPAPVPTASSSLLVEDDSQSDLESVVELAARPLESLPKLKVKPNANEDAADVSEPEPPDPSQAEIAIDNVGGKRLWISLGIALIAAVVLLALASR